MFSLLVSQLHRENGLGFYWIWMGGVHRGGSMQYSGTRQGRNWLRTLFLWWEPGVGVDADEQAVGGGLSYSHWQQGRVPLNFW
jgi:hypothetical protein